MRLVEAANERAREGACQRCRSPAQTSASADHRWQSLGQGLLSSKAHLGLLPDALPAARVVQVALKAPPERSDQHQSHPVGTNQQVGVESRLRSQISRCK